MRFIEGLDALDDLDLGALYGDSLESHSVVSVGVFDGVHQGHRHLMSRLSAEAARTGRLAGVVTFRNHPASVLGQNFKPRYLTSVEERLRLIKALGCLVTKKVALLLFKSLKDPNPLIRSQAAKGLGNFRNEKTIVPLSALLEDPNWWCRTHAAYAISKTGPAGIEFLENRLETTRNLSAKKIIRQVLNEQI